MRESCTEKKRGAKKRQNLEERKRFSEAACRKEAERKEPGSERRELQRGRGKQRS